MHPSDAKDGNRADAHQADADRGDAHQADAHQADADDDAGSAYLTSGSPDLWPELRPKLWPELRVRGALFVIFMASLVGDLGGQYLHMAALTSLGFAAGCAAATVLARRQDLLIVVTTPPMIFLAAVTCAEVLAAHARGVSLAVAPIAAGVFLTLAATAPWLFCTVLAALALAVIRGLGQCISELRSQLSPGIHR